MTVPAVATAGGRDADAAVVLGHIERALRDASSRLAQPVSAADVHAVEQMIEHAKSSLGQLSVDPWDAAVRPLREARDILGSHLLAAAAIAGADMAPPITADVLRRGVDAARLTLSLRQSTAGERPR